MEGYGILVHRRGESRRYRAGSGDSELAETWELAEAAEIAHRFLIEREATHVTVGNGDHEFRMWGEGVDDYGNFTRPGNRWADWYVDVELNGRRWRYRPCADLDDLAATDEIADRAEELDEITKIWIGASDGSEEYEKEKQG